MAPAADPWPKILRDYLLLRQYGGAATVNHIHRLTKTLHAEAGALYYAAATLRRVGGIPANQRWPANDIRKRLVALRFNPRDFFVKRVLDNVAKRSPVPPGKRLTTIDEIQQHADALADAKDIEVADLTLYLALVAENRRPSGRGRFPSVAMEYLFVCADRLILGDAALARRLDKAGIEPDVTLTEEEQRDGIDRVERWRTIIKAARARRRR